MESTYAATEAEARTMLAAAHAKGRSGYVMEWNSSRWEVRTWR